MHPFISCCLYAGFATVVGFVTFLVMSANSSGPGTGNLSASSAVLGEAIGNPETASVPVIVKFGAPWCGPCREIDAELNKLERSYRQKVKVVQINVDERPDLADKCGIEQIPHLFLYVDNKAVKQHQGVLTKSELATWIGLQ